MSTKFYGYRINKDDWWDFADTITEFYHQKNPMALIAREGINYEKGGEALVASFDLFDSLRKREGGDKNIAEIQLWDEGDTYIFRVLEKGYFFFNSVKEEDWPLERITYVNTFDVPEEMKPLKEVVDWVDQQIEDGRYFIYPLLSWDDVRGIAMELALDYRKDIDDEN